MDPYEKLKIENLNVYHKKGGEQPILFLHGAWGNGWQWLDNYFAYFSNSYDCYAMDLSSHGHSTSNKRLNFLSLNQYTEDLSKVINQLPNKPILIAHSMGGIIAQKYIKKNPEKISQLVLLAPACRPGVWKVTLKTILRQPFSFLLANLKLNLYPIINSPKKANRIMFTKHYKHHIMEEVLENLQGESYVAYLNMLFHSQYKSGSRNFPILLMGADQDYLFSVKNFQNTAKRLSADLHIIGGMGHHFFMQSRWEESAKAIQNWLEKSE